MRSISTFSIDEKMHHIVGHQQSKWRTVNKEPPRDYQTLFIISIIKAEYRRDPHLGAKLKFLCLEYATGRNPYKVATGFYDRHSKILFDLLYSHDFLIGGARRLSF